MATRVHHDALNESWNALRDHEEETGKIPLPAIDTIHLDSERLPSIVLVAPDVIPNATHVFVDVERMPPADKVTLFSLLDELADVVRVNGDLEAVFHCGGLSYLFQGATGQAIESHELPSNRWPQAWSILRAIALIGARNPDITGSTLGEPSAPAP